MDNNKIKNKMTILIIFIIIITGILRLLRMTGLSILFIIGILSICICFYIINPILYEMGHVIFGLISGWKINKVIIKNIILYEKGKLKFKYKKNKNKRVLGITYMYQQNSNDKYVLALLGGIIVDIISLIILTIIYVCSNDIYMKVIIYSFIISIIITIVINIIPQKIGTIETDVLKLLKKQQCYKNNTIQDEIQLTKVLIEMKDKKISEIPDEEFLLNKPLTNDYIILLNYIYTEKLEGKKKIQHLERLLNCKSSNINKNVIYTEIIINKILYDYDKKKVDKLYNNKAYQEYLKSSENNNFEVLIVKYCYNKINKKTKQANKILNKINLIFFTTKDEETKNAELKLLDEIKKIN